MMTPQKYPQNLHTQKYSFFWKPEKKTEIQILNPKKSYLRLRMYDNIRVPPPGDSLQNYETSYHYFFNLWRSQSRH